MHTEHMDGFWRGFASALNLAPSHRARHRRAQYMFRGQNVLTLSVADALAQDRDMVSAQISSAAMKEAVDEPVGSPR